MGGNDRGRHSWFKNKMLSYSVTLHVPSLLATERAKCSRATNALRACVKERDEAVERQEEAEAEVKETDSTVEVCMHVCMFVQWSLPVDTGGDRGVCLCRIRGVHVEIICPYLTWRCEFEVLRAIC